MFYRVPPNCFFEVDDFESDWSFSKPFDFIHGRNLAGSVRDFLGLYERIMCNLKPGGWVEMVDFAGDRFLSDDDTVQNSSSLNEWARLLNEACNKFGKEFGIARNHKQWLIDSGFKNVRENVYKVGYTTLLMCIPTNYLSHRSLSILGRKNLR